MSRIRLNSEYRNKGAVRFREHLEQENTQEKESYLQAREQIIPLQKDTWKLAEKIVRRHYTNEDVKMAYHLQNKFENVDTIAKDSCFHFGYMGKPDEKDEDDKYITKHFDFRLDGNINGSESGRQNNFAYAMFRDELKGRDNCNPDINIEQVWGKAFAPQLRKIGAPLFKPSRNQDECSPPYPPAYLCHAYAGRRGRPSGDPRTSGPFQSYNDPGIYSCNQA